jgi:hypothetical protein
MDHKGAVAFAVTAFEQRDCRHENSSPSPGSHRPLGLRRFRFPPDVIVLAVRWYLRFGLSYRDVEELLAERGVEVDHVNHLPLGPAVHAAAGRGRSAVSAHRRFPLMGRRDLCEGRRPVARRLPRC